jgi:26S proteasome regulatory subunit T4
MDGFDSLGKTKLIMATNRPDTLDPALLRPGRLDRKIEIPLPNEQGRLEILKIHAKGINKSGDIDYEAVVKLSDGFNGADLRNVCTEAGMFAIREDRYVFQAIPEAVSGSAVEIWSLDCSSIDWPALLALLSDLLMLMLMLMNRDAILQDDLMKAVRKLNDAKKHETSA